MGNRGRLPEGPVIGPLGPERVPRGRGEGVKSERTFFCVLKDMYKAAAAKIKEICDKVIFIEILLS